MKIKKIIAPNMMQALSQIKLELGDDAIIISNEKTSDGQILVTAAVDESFDIDFDINDDIEILDKNVKFQDNRIRECLNYHGVVDNLTDKILSLSRQVAIENNLSNDKRVLVESFQKIFGFCDILDLKNPIKLFMGTPGSGKSTAIAKTATQAKINKIKTCIISTDNVRAGANQQLEAFAKILELDFYFCKNEKVLFDTLQNIKSSYQLILIDTPGINPFIENEVEKVAKISETIKHDGIVILDAGRNPYETVEIADIFVSLGAKYLLPTRLDLTRRIGSIISVAGCCNLNFCAASVSSSIARGLAPIDSQSLAKLILNES